MKIIVDIADARFSNCPNDEIITYSLGSCIGVVMHDPATKATGMLHYQLPSSKADTTGIKKNPLMFADTGIQHMIENLTALGAQKKQLRVKIAGGAQMMNDAHMFNIGKRNYSAVRQILWKNGLFIDAEDVGGKLARTMSVKVADGQVCIKCQGKTSDL